MNAHPLPVERARDLDVSEVEDGFIILAADATDVVHLNGAASLVFELCNGSRTVDQIVATVRTEIPDGSVGAAEVTACLDQLHALGLVRLPGRPDDARPFERRAGQAGRDDAPYDRWLARHAFRPDRDRGPLEQRLEALDRLVVVELRVVATAEDLHACRELVASLQSQVTAGRIDWRLTIVVEGAVAPHHDLVGDLDARVTVDVANRPGEATAAEALAEDAEWLVPVRPGEVLAPHALAEIVLAADRAQRLGRPPAAVYVDEDDVDDAGHRTAPRFKPGPSLELMRATGYAATAIAYRTAALRELGETANVVGADGFDTMLRVLERWGTAGFVHVPDVLVHRRHPALLGDPDLEQRGRALQAHLDRLGVDAEASSSPGRRNLRVRHRLASPHPLVSIVIPTRDQVDLLEVAVASILDLTTYPNFEIVVIDNDSTDEATLAWLDRARRRPEIDVRSVPGEFNFSRICNDGVAGVRGSIVALVNNDIEVTDGAWLEELVSWAQLDRVGAAGAMLRYDDGSVQHAGIVTGLGRVAGHSHKRRPRGDLGYLDRLDAEQNLLGVTAACVVLRASVFHEVGGFDATSFPVAFNDVDLCLRIVEAGYDIVWTPAADLIHHESRSRGLDLEDAPRRRSRAEGAALRARWVPLLDHDPFYSPNLTHDHEDFSIGVGRSIRASAGRQVRPRAIVHAGMPSTGTASIAAAVAGYDDGTIVAGGRRPATDLDPTRSVLLTTADLAGSGDGDPAGWSPAAISEAFDTVTVIGFVRDVGGYLRAALQRDVRSGVSAPALDGHHPAYRRRFAPWFEVVDGRDIHLLPYVPADWPTGSAVTELARRVGLRDLLRSDAPPAWLHRSDAAEVTAVLAAYNVGHLARHGVAPSEQRLEIIADRLGSLGRRRLRIAPATVQRIAADHAEDLDWMATALLSGSTDPYDALLAAPVPGGDHVTITDAGDLLELARASVPDLRHLATGATPTGGPTDDVFDELVDLVDQLLPDPGDARGAAT